MRRNEMTVRARTEQVIIDNLGLSRDEIKPEMDFIKDMGADSLDCVEITMALEEEFDMEISDEDAEKMPTIGKCLDYIEARMAARKVK